MCIKKIVYMQREIIVIYNVHLDRALLGLPGCHFVYVGCRVNISKTNIAFKMDEKQKEDGERKMSL